MKIRFLAVAAALWISLSILPSAALGAAALEDGTYTADYVILKAENDSVSMANDYWEKPATVVVKDGQATVRMTINHSLWVTQFKVPGKGGFVDTKVVERNAKEDRRSVEFTADVAKPIEAKIHVTVAEIDYDHDYTIRIVFREDGFQLVEPAKPEAPPAAPEKGADSPAPGAGDAGGPGTAEAAPTTDAAPAAPETPTTDASEGAKPEPATGGGDASAVGGAPQPTRSEGAPPDEKADTAAVSVAKEDGDRSDVAASEAPPQERASASVAEASDGAAPAAPAAEEPVLAPAGSEAAASGDEAIGTAAGETASSDMAAAVETAAVETPAAEQAPARSRWWSPVGAIALLAAGSGWILWRRKALAS